MPRHVTSTSFKKGHIPHNKIRESKKVPCIVEGCSNLRGFYSNKSGLCKIHSYEKRRNEVKRRVWKTGYVYAEGGNRPKPEHIRIAEKALGRPLKKGEVVHHIDLNRANNVNSNLLICSPSYHTWLHAEYGRQFVKRILCPQLVKPNK